MGYHCASHNGGMGDVPDSVIQTLEAMAGDWPDPPKDFAEVDQSLVDMLREDDYVTHEGLVDLAHKDGLRLTFTEPVQIPDQDDDTKHGVVFRAFAVTDRGIFTGYGDATSENTGVSGADVRMAETRALSRALRTAVNSAGTVAAEMPDSDDGVNDDW